MKVKICGLTDRDNITEILDLNPDYAGFIFFSASPRYMGNKLTPDDIDSLNLSAKKTGVFVNSDFDEIELLYRMYKLDCVQLHGNESPALCRKLESLGIEVIKAFGLHEDFSFQQLNEYIPCCRYFLFDTRTELKGGSGKKFNWEIIDKYNFDHPFFLSGGITAYDAPEILKIKHPSLAGVDLNSRFEDSPGIKNISKLTKFITELRKQEL